MFVYSKSVIPRAASAVLELSILKPCPTKSWTIAGMRFTGTMANPCFSSMATPPQWAPPMLPGWEMIPSRLGGVNGPSFRRSARILRQAALASGVGPHASSAE